MKMLRLRETGKRFGGKWAVRGVSIHVPPGEVFGLVGPNGAGKTTALRMAAGLLSPTEGSVEVCGLDIQKDTVRAKALMGYIPDRAFLYEKLTAREHMLFVSSIYGVDKNGAAKRTEDLLAVFGIGEAADALIEGFSQGMRQRLLFASSLLHEPRVLLIDEPFVGLDPFGIDLVKEKILEVSRAGTSVLLATHSLSHAAELCLRVGFIERGALRFTRDKEEIAAHEGGIEALFKSDFGHERT